VTVVALEFHMRIFVEAPKRSVAYVSPVSVRALSV
jgi:hypothetical protein